MDDEVLDKHSLEQAHRTSRAGALAGLHIYAYGTLNRYGAVVAVIRPRTLRVWCRHLTQSSQRPRRTGRNGLGYLEQHFPLPSLHFP